MINQAFIAIAPRFHQAVVGICPQFRRSFDRILSRHPKRAARASTASTFLVAIKCDHVEMRVRYIVAILVVDCCYVSSQTVRKLLTKGAHQIGPLFCCCLHRQSNTKALADPSFLPLGFVLSRFRDLYVPLGTHSFANNCPGCFGSSNVAQMCCRLPDKCLPAILLSFIGKCLYRMPK